MLGKVLGAYRIESELGSGGMGTVWLATDADDQSFAIKVIHAHLLESPGFFKRFLREAEIGKTVRHPNVVRCYDADALRLEGEQQNFLVMEYVEGQTLRDLLEELDRVPEELCRHIGREVAKGLAAIHDAGVVHRDLKPENVLITPEHEVKVMDLGVARLADDAIRLSQSGAFVGSIHYAAPEQFRGGGKDLDGRADLHALGLILYELSSGTHPYVADDVPQVLKRVLNDTPRRLGELNPQLSAFFEEVAHTLIAKERERRFGSANDLLRVLEKGEDSTWWQGRARALRAETKRPLRRVRIPRETAVYGREDELAKLRSLYVKAKEGDGRVVLVEGEAGIGKSRLVDELIGRLQQDGEDVNFLFGSYPPGGAATASGAWSTAYREQFGAEGLEETLAEYLTITPVLIPAFSALLRGEPPPDGKEALTKDSLQTVFIHATQALASERPTVVLIEDLHFAPEEGRAMFASLAQVVPESRILLAGTTRPGIPEEWRANLERLEHASRVGLSRLGPKDLAHLLREAFQSERLAEELSYRIGEKSDGNPFFVFEIIRGLCEGQFITRRPDGTWASTQVIQEIEIPSSVQDLIQARIADLSEDEQELLDVAACCGFRFDPGLVAEVLELRPIRALRRLGGIEKAHRLVRSAGENFLFDHHQVQETLYAGMSERLRREYHAAIGSALAIRKPEPGGAVAVDLCDHFLKGGIAERALPHLESALEHLQAGYQREQAIDLSDRALLTPDLPSGVERGRLLVTAVQLRTFLGRSDRVHELLTEALDLAKAARDLGLQARVETALSHHADSAEKSTRWKTEAIRHAREIGDLDAEFRPTEALAQSEFSAGRYDQAWRNLRRVAEITEELGERRQRIHLVEGLFHLQVGEWRLAEDAFLRGIEVAKEAGDRWTEGQLVGTLGVVYAYQGANAQAIARYEWRIRNSLEIGDSLGVAISSENTGIVLVELGRADRADTYFEVALRNVRQAGQFWREQDCVLSMAESAAQQGNDQSAAELYESVLAAIPDDSILTAYAKLGLGELAASGRLIRDPRPLLEGALAYARDRNSPELSELAGIQMLAMLHLAHLPGGEPREAIAAFKDLTSNLRTRVQMEVQFLLWQLTSESTSLVESHRLLCHIRDHAPDEYRETMIVNVPLYRNIMAAWDEHGGEAV